MERLATVWLNAREESGVSEPIDSIEDILGSGPLPCLHHMTSFFTVRHHEKLAEEAATVETEA